MKIILVFVFFAMAITNKSFSQKSFVVPEQKISISDGDSIRLLTLWKSFLTDINEKNFPAIENISLEKVYCKSIGNSLQGVFKDKLISIDVFIDSILPKFYDSRFIGVLNDSVPHFYAAVYPDRKPLNFRLATNQKLTTYDIYFSEIVPGEWAKNLNFYVFRFVKKGGEFKFFELYLESPH